MPCFDMNVVSFLFNFKANNYCSYFFHGVDYSFQSLLTCFRIFRSVSFSMQSAGLRFSNRAGIHQFLLISVILTQQDTTQMQTPAHQLYEHCKSVFLGFYDTQQETPQRYFLHTVKEDEIMLIITNDTMMTFYLESSNPFYHFLVLQSIIIYRHFSWYQSVFE